MPKGIRKTAVILAGGTGSRAGGPLPKQFQELCGRPAVWWSMKAFRQEDPDCGIVLVVHPDYRDVWDGIYRLIPEEDRIPHTVCSGGADRTQSVRNGLACAVKPADEKGIDLSGMKIAVHDGARPLVSTDMIRRGWEACSAGVCGVPVVPVTSSLRRLLKDCEHPDGCDSLPADRSEYVEVQTPQTFVASDLERSYREKGDGSYTDDASLAQTCGIRVKLFKGMTDNMKITNPEDFAIATILMSKQQSQG